MRILLVEDNEIDVLAFRRAVSKYRPNVGVIHYVNIDDALRELSTDDFLIVDLNGTGAATPEEMIERLSEVPIGCRVVYTGRVDWETGYKCGRKRIGYIPKPPNSTDSERLVALVGHALGMFEAFQEYESKLTSVARKLCPA